MAEAAVRMYPYLIVYDDKFIPLAGTTATRHYGEANLSNVINNIKKTFISLKRLADPLQVLKTSNK